MRINEKKTKVLMCDKNKRGGKFYYLGSLITNDGRTERGIMRRIVQAKNAFGKKLDLSSENI